MPVLALPVLVSVSVSRAAYQCMYLGIYVVAIRSPLGNCSSPCDSLGANKGGAFDLLSVLSIASLCLTSFRFISFRYFSFCLVPVSVFAHLFVFGLPRHNVNAVGPDQARPG